MKSHLEKKKVKETTITLKHLYNNNAKQLFFKTRIKGKTKKKKKAMDLKTRNYDVVYLPILLICRF
jgi:hypothetical protein